MVNDNNKPLFTARTVPPVSPDIAGMPGSNPGATESKPGPQSDQPKPADNPRGVSEQNKPQTAPSTTPEEDYYRATDASIQAYRSWLDAHPMETPEQQAKREKRERSKRVIAAVTDGLSALGNLFFTTKGAPSMYDGQNTQTAAVRRQQDKLKAEREANADKYFNYAMHIGSLEAGKAKTAHEWRRQKEEAELKAKADRRAADDYEFDKSLRGFKTKEAEGRADKAAADAVTAQITADNAQAYQTSRINRNNRPPAARMSGGSKNDGVADRYHVGNRGFKSEKDWETEVMRQADLFGIPQQEVVKGAIGQPDRMRYRKPADIAADVERALRIEADDDTPPSRR